MSEWETVIGLEVHARLLTRTKIFCPCPADFGADPNTQVCPICLGYPGALPLLNRHAVTLALRMALATGCTIHRRSIFARKNYFYPDLPKGYQISQSDRPFATDGHVEFHTSAGPHRVTIQRIHLEEDAGKSLHANAFADLPADVSLVDLNRAGAPLIEIVTNPDIRSSEEAIGYLTRLRQMLMFAGVCDGSMEEGSLRCDANVSVRRKGATYGTRTEIKNLNSFRYLGRAIEFEVARQIELLDAGSRVTLETRLYDSAAGETRVMRSKEEAHDYRYFPDPDLFALDIDEPWLEEIAHSLPAMPAARSARYQQELGLSVADAEALVATRGLADYYEAVAAEAQNPKLAANWVRNEVLRILNDEKCEIEDYRVTPVMLGRLIRMIESGAIGGKVAKEVFEEMSSTGAPPDSIVEMRGLTQISDPELIRAAAIRVIAASPAQVEQFRGGKQQIFGYLVGQLMKETRGKANADVANRLLRELLGA